MVDDVVVDGAPRSSRWIFPSKIVLHSSVHTYLFSKAQHPPVVDVSGLLHPIGQPPRFLPDEEVKNWQGSGLDRPTRLHQISGRNAKPKFRLSSFKRLFQRPSRLSHRIGLLFRPARPVATRCAVPKSRPALGQTIDRSAPSKSLPSGVSERPCRAPDGRGKTTTTSKASFEG